MLIRSQVPFSVGAFLRQLFLIVAIAVVSTAESRAQSTFNMEQIDSLTAPIALYPDTLLAQVMIASTYPAEVAQAAQWAQQNSSLQGTALDNALQQQPWDPSVKALVQTPSVLQQMNSKLDWTQQLGDAVLAQQGDVMDSVQRLRQRAQGAGNLMTTPQQTVVTQPATVPGGQQTIVIEQADPQVLYVPAYEPQVVYGGPRYRTRTAKDIVDEPMTTVTDLIDLMEIGDPEVFDPPTKWRTFRSRRAWSTGPRAARSSGALIACERRVRRAPLRRAGPRSAAPRSGARRPRMIDRRACG